MAETPHTDLGTKPGGNGDTPQRLVCEVSWEVCAQAGGIYTVLRSKAPSAVRRWRGVTGVVENLAVSVLIVFESDSPHLLSAYLGPN